MRIPMRIEVMLPTSGSELHKLITEFKFVFGFRHRPSSSDSLWGIQNHRVMLDGPFMGRLL